MVSLAVLYNVVFVVGRAVFWEINRGAPPFWYFLDYLCDFIYLIDTLVRMHEGELYELNSPKHKTVPLNSSLTKFLLYPSINLLCEFGWTHYRWTCVSETHILF